jgi:2-hydroxy-3-oxopropionate reductase
VKSVGVIGLGSMGGPMATHLVGAGFDVHVFDVRRSAIHQAVSAGARATASIREVAERSEAVIVMVVDDEQTRDVVAGPEGLLDGSRKGLIVVLSSSLHPGTARSLYALARDRGVEVVDVPVTGGVRGAIEGKLTCLVGGDENTYQRIKQCGACGLRWKRSSREGRPQCPSLARACRDQRGTTTGGK